ncbi:LysR family transcriptional regulator [Pseudohoeflea coraliihabitans]|uniref:LysR family transcriptional regulator n=1 Tax=Pseudohoeflea coraliihabitans TaxID=2860393 RepID=A0ABS6WQS6_9HYPH|nr:LysR family transcriptional regulator [Pseudohoeflea sp. DP4N28-3]MBW3098318.1 LysR family transcriptional regulator [Pseudohoeflea sp. DP4N28-3]
MKLQQLEAFYWIANLGSFAAAAERLGLTQPSVSQRIHELEAELGVALFERVGRRARLSDLGHSLLPHAEEMLAVRQRILHQVGNPTHLRGTVRLGVAELVALTWLPALIDRLGQLYPGVTLELDIDLTEDLWSKLDQGLLDAALVPKLKEHPHVHTRLLGTMPFSWMASPELNVPDRLLHPGELVEWPILLLSQHSNLFGTVEKWFADAGAQMQRRALSNNLNSIAALTMRGLGISTLPPDLYAQEIASGRLCRLRTEPPLPAVAYWAVHRRQQTESLAGIVAAIATECTTFDMSGAESAAALAEAAR